jgi:hypothetical protein
LVSKLLKTPRIATQFIPYSHAYIDNTGLIVLTSSTFEREIVCTMDFDAYPFDTQYCPLIFGSYHHSIAEVCMFMIPIRRSYTPDHHRCI